MSLIRPPSHKIPDPLVFSEGSRVQTDADAYWVRGKRKGRPATVVQYTLEYRARYLLEREDGTREWVADYGVKQDES